MLNSLNDLKEAFDLAGTDQDSADLLHESISTLTLTQQPVCPEACANPFG